MNTFYFKIHLKSTLSNHPRWVLLFDRLLQQLDVVIHVGQVVVGRLQVLHGLLLGALGLEDPLGEVLVGQGPGVHQLFAGGDKESFHLVDEYEKYVELIGSHPCIP